MVDGRRQSVRPATAACAGPRKCAARHATATFRDTNGRRAATLGGMSRTRDGRDRDNCVTVGSESGVTAARRAAGGTGAGEWASPGRRPGNVAFVLAIGNGLAAPN